MPKNTPHRITEAAGPPCHVDSVTIRPALQQGAHSLMVADVLRHMSQGLRYYIVTESPLPSTVLAIEAATCKECGADTLTAAGAETDHIRSLAPLRRFDFFAA